MPAMENMNSAMAAAVSGSLRDNPARSVISSTITPLRRMDRMQAKAPSVMQT